MNGSCESIHVRERTRSFHVGMSIAFLATAFAGFAPTYYLKSLTHGPAASLLLHVHALAFTSWLVLLFAQSTLVSARRVDLHKRLGIGASLLAAVMIPLGMVTALAGLRNGLSRASSDPLAFIIFPLGQMVLFGVFVGMALWTRKQPECHRRFILLGTTCLMTPAIVRLPFVGGQPIVALVLSGLFVVAGMIHDRRAIGRVHPIYIRGLVVILLSGPIRYALGHTDAWRSFARFLVE